MSFTPDIAGAEVVPSPKLWRGRKAKWPVSAVIQHYTASLAEAGLVKWMAESASTSAHLFIYRTGHVVQMVRFQDRAFHAGEKQGSGFWPPGKPQETNVNNFSIGIENCNVGWVLKQGDRFFLPKFTTSGVVAGSPYKGPAPQQARDHTGAMRWWEPYTDELVAANVVCLKQIVDKYGLGPEAIGFHSDVSPRRKTDPGPLWPHEYVLSEVFGSTKADAASTPTVRAEPVEDNKNPDPEEGQADIRGDNGFGTSNPEWHYDYDRRMSMIEEVDGMCMEKE